MGYVVVNIGDNSNIPYQDIRCDTEADIELIDVNKVPPGSTIYVIDSQVVKMLNTKKEWIIQ